MFRMDTGKDWRAHLIGTNWKGKNELTWAHWSWVCPLLGKFGPESHFLLGIEVIFQDPLYTQVGQYEHIIYVIIIIPVSKSRFFFLQEGKIALEFLLREKCVCESVKERKPVWAYVCVFKAENYNTQSPSFLVWCVLLSWMFRWCSLALEPSSELRLPPSLFASAQCFAWIWVISSL